MYLPQAYRGTQEDYFLKKAIKKVGGAVKKGGRALDVTSKKSSIRKAGRWVDKNVTQKVADLAKYAILLPLIPVMVLALKKKGIKASASPGQVETTAQLFYNNVVAKKGSDFEPIDFEEFEGDEYDNLSGDVVSAIVAFIRGGIKEATDGKVPKSPVMKTVVEEGQKVLGKLERKAVSNGQMDPKEAVTEIGSSTIPNKGIGAAVRITEVIKEPVNIAGINIPGWLIGGLVLAGITITVIAIRK